MVVDRSPRDTRRSAISALRSPSATSASTSSSRGGQRAGFVARRGSRAAWAPSARARAAAARTRAAPPGGRRAPRTSGAPRGGASSSPLSASARAASYGQPRAVHAAAAPRASPAIWRAYGSAIQSGASSSSPAFHCQYASSPANQRCRFSSARLVDGASPRRCARPGRPRATRPRRAPRGRGRGAGDARPASDDLERLVEHVADARIAASRADASERDQRCDSADRADRRRASSSCASAVRFVPAAAVDEASRRASERMYAEVEVVLGSRTR